MRVFSCEFFERIIMRIAVFAMCLFFAAQALHAQNLYINNSSVWHSPDSLYCDNLDLSFTGPAAYAVGVPVSGTLYAKFMANEHAIADKMETNSGYRCVTGSISASTAVISIPVGSASGTLYNTQAVAGEGFGTQTPFSGNVNLTANFANAYDGASVQCVEKQRMGGASGNTHSFSFSSWPTDFETGGTVGWEVYNGVLRSGNMQGQDKVYSELVTRPYFEYATKVSWSGSISSEAAYDRLFFYVDDKLEYVSSSDASSDGAVYSISHSTVVLPGVHTLRWTYGKDISDEYGFDRSTITAISFDHPAYKTYNLYTPYYSKNATVSDPAATVLIQNGTDMVFYVSSQTIINNELICTSGRPLCSSGQKRIIFQKEYNEHDPIVDSYSSNPTINAMFVSIYNSNYRDSVFNELQEKEKVGARGFLDIKNTRAEAPLSGMKLVPNAAVFTANVQNVSFVKDDPINRSALIEFEQPRITYPANCLALCAAIQCASSTSPITFGIDELTFEVFRFQQGTNPLDPSSSPPIKTIPIFNLGNGHRCAFNDEASTHKVQMFGTYCAAWDAMQNLNGDFGKNNGIYGFRAKVKTSQMTSQGTQVDIEQTSAYPGQNQMPISVNVTNIHNTTFTI